MSTQRRRERAFGGPIVPYENNGSLVATLRTELESASIPIEKGRRYQWVEVEERDETYLKLEPVEGTNGRA